MKYCIVVNKAGGGLLSTYGPVHSEESAIDELKGKRWKKHGRFHNLWCRGRLSSLIAGKHARIFKIRRREKLHKMKPVEDLPVMR
jgi:hypothetical protein